MHLAAAPILRTPSPAPGRPPPRPPTAIFTDAQQGRLPRWDSTDTVGTPTSAAALPPAPAPAAAQPVEPRPGPAPAPLSFYSVGLEEGVGVSPRTPQQLASAPGGGSSPVFLGHKSQQKRATARGLLTSPRGAVKRRRAAERAEPRTEGPGSLEGSGRLRAGPAEGAGKAPAKQPAAQHSAAARYPHGVQAAGCGARAHAAAAEGSARAPAAPAGRAQASAGAHATPAQRREQVRVGAQGTAGPQASAEVGNNTHPQLGPSDAPPSATPEAEPVPSSAPVPGAAPAARRPGSSTAGAHSPRGSLVEAPAGSAGASQAHAAGASDRGAVAELSLSMRGVDGVQGVSVPGLGVPPSPEPPRDAAAPPRGTPGGRGSSASVMSAAVRGASRASANASPRRTPRPPAATPAPVLLNLQSPAMHKLSQYLDHLDLCDTASRCGRRRGCCLCCVWNWFVEKLVDLNHACWCLSVLWTAIPESNVRTVSCSSNKMNQPQSPKRKKKPQKNNFCPFLPILDAAAKILLIINSKHPTQKLGFHETLGFARYGLAHMQHNVARHTAPHRAALHHMAPHP